MSLAALYQQMEYGKWLGRQTKCSLSASDNVICTQPLASSASQEHKLVYLWAFMFLALNRILLLCGNQLLGSGEEDQPSSFEVAAAEERSDTVCSGY